GDFPVPIWDSPAGQASTQAELEKSMKRKASAIWNGDLKTGNGTISAASGALADTPYSFKTRFEEAITGTNPDELLAAAHAGCYSMALSAQLAAAGHSPQSVDSQATLE